MRGRSGVVAAAIVFATFVPGASQTTLLFPSDRAAGGEWMEREGRRVSVASGDVWALDGLRCDGARLNLRHRRWETRLEVVRLSAGIGSEARLSVGLGGGGRAFWCRVSVHAHRVTLGAASWSDVTAGVEGTLPLSPSVRCVASVDGIELYGLARSEDIATDARVVITPSRMLRMEVGVNMDRVRGANVILAARMQPLEAWAIGGGFDGARECFSVTTALSRGSVGVEVGADVHAVLGVSRMVCVRWER